MKVGDYVRTKDGVIAKITDIIEDFSVDCDRDVFDLDELAMMEIPWDFKDEYIIKYSPNIIDLIEAGDYVNGHKIIFVNDTFTYASVQVETSGEATVEIIPVKDIKSIVTKERFSSMEYRIGE